MNQSDICEFRIFMVEQGERVLVAFYLTAIRPPAVGTVLDIKMFKEKDAYPDQVRVLSVEEASSDEDSDVEQAAIFSVIVEPA
jgi:hypothetical protein